MQEIWKDVIGYEGIYKISNIGRVMSMSRVIITSKGPKKLSKDKLLSNKERHGYPRVILSKDNKVKHRDVHTLVAESFLGYSKNIGLVVDHIDNNPSNNNVSNLQIITHRMNCSKDKKRKVNLPNGVTMSTSKRFRATYSNKGINTYIGTFNCQTAASLAYQKAII